MLKMSDMWYNLIKTNVPTLWSHVLFIAASLYLYVMSSSNCWCGALAPNINCRISTFLERHCELFIFSGHKIVILYTKVCCWRRKTSVVTWNKIRSFNQSVSGWWISSGSPSWTPLIPRRRRRRVKDSFSGLNPPPPPSPPFTIMERVPQRDSDGGRRSDSLVSVCVFRKKQLLRSQTGGRLHIQSGHLNRNQNLWE